MGKPGRPKGSVKLNNKISKTFRLSRHIIKWLKSKKNMTETVENALEKEMENEK